MQLFLRYVEIAAKNAAQQGLGLFSCAFHHYATLTKGRGKRHFNDAR
jgi:hypothetical protein